MTNSRSEHSQRVEDDQHPYIQSDYAASFGGPAQATNGSNDTRSEATSQGVRIGGGGLFRLDGSSRNSVAIDGRRGRLRHLGLDEVDRGVRKRQEADASSHAHDRGKSQHETDHDARKVADDDCVDDDEDVFVTKLPEAEATPVG